MGVSESKRSDAALTRHGHLHVVKHCGVRDVIDVRSYARSDSLCSGGDELPGKICAGAFSPYRGAREREVTDHLIKDFGSGVEIIGRRRHLLDKSGILLCHSVQLRNCMVEL